jgi:galactokinase
MSREVQAVIEAFEQQFPGSKPEKLFRAPGRINLIGEHTDYNLGFVLPMALHLACYAASAPSSDQRLHLYSHNLGEERNWKLEEIPDARPTGEWTDYVVGVAQQLLQLGYQLRPLNIALSSTVPVGSGLSSSAALEISAALALLQSEPIDRRELALLAQRAERNFVGVPCGIMDQYVSVFGEKNHAIRIDCRDTTHMSAVLPSGASIVAVNSMVKHQLGDSAYAQRVEECQRAVTALQEGNPHIQSLRDVSVEQIEAAKAALDDKAYRRARHVTTENERVLQFVAAAADADEHAMGRLLIASHRSLEKDYEVSCEEVDFLVDTASQLTGVFGARMTGAGFGGCTVNLVAHDGVTAFEHYIKQAYQEKYGIDPAVYHCSPARGAEEIGIG